MIQQLQHIFHSLIKSLEVFYVLKGKKPCARILVFEGELGKALNFLDDKGISACVSDFKVIKENAQSEFYSDKSIKIPKNDARKGCFFVYLSKDEEKAEKAKLAEEDNNHRGIGESLGYPKCCCDFFEKNFSKDAADLTLKVLDDSEGCQFPFYNNIAARHFDVALLSHFPHSFNCAASSEIAKSSLELIRKENGQLADTFSRILSSVVVYSSNEGIFLLRKYEKIGGEIAYGDVLTTTKSKLYYLLSSNKKLKINGKNNFTVSGINIKGMQYGVMVFG